MDLGSVGQPPHCSIDGRGVRGKHDRRSSSRDGAVRRSRQQLWLSALLAAAFLGVSVSCGYHTGGKAVRLPPDLRTIYVPAFVNATQTYHVSETLTAAVVRELRSRTNYRVITSNNDASADATLNATVTSATTGALTYDSVTGRISSSLVVVTVRVSLVNNNGKVLWDNPSFLFREQYQVSTDPASFFSEENPAVQRIASDFSRSLVSDLLESY